MGSFSAALDRDLHLEICDRARRGEPRKAIAIDLDVSEVTAAKWTAHIPYGDRRDLVRASILERVTAGDSLDCIVSLEACSLHFVATIVHAHFAEEEARRPRHAPETSHVRPATKKRRAKKARPEPPRRGSLLEQLYRAHWSRPRAKG